MPKEVPCFGIGTQELIIILVIVLFIFGAKRLPEIGKSLGKSIREFKNSVTGESENEDQAKLKENSKDTKDKTS
ncbi:MAG: twin-arginine translocase TatA/TatE family subunit [Thermodesulfobacteriota bacterium]